MKRVTAARATRDFGDVLDIAQSEPVVITKGARPVGVLLSMRDIEDTALGEQALKAHREGYVGAKNSWKIIVCLMHETP